MSQPYFCIRIVDGRNVVGYTTDGKDFYPIPKGAFGRPGDAVRYCEMRQQGVSPIRSADEVTVVPVTAIPPLRQSEAAHPASMESPGQSS